MQVQFSILGTWYIWHFRASNDEQPFDYLIVCDYKTMSFNLMAAATSCVCCILRVHWVCDFVKFLWKRFFAFWPLYLRAYYIYLHIAVRSAALKLRDCFVGYAPFPVSLVAMPDPVSSTKDGKKFCSHDEEILSTLYCDCYMNALSFLVLSSEELQISFPLPAVRVLLAMTNITFYFATEKDSTPCSCWELFPKLPSHPNTLNLTRPSIGCSEVCCFVSDVCVYVMNSLSRCTS